MDLTRTCMIALLAAALALSSCRCTPSGGANPRASDTAASPARSGIPQEEAMKCPAALVEARKDGSIPNRYVVPTDEERTQMRSLVQGIVAEGSTVSIALASHAARIGFEIVRVSGADDLAVLREIEGKRRGGGAYLVRLGSHSRLIVQAPHTFYDEGTLPLACDLFARSNARALFINTMHRYKGAPADSTGQHPSDVAHAPASLFQAATEGATSAIGSPTCVQVHGFAAREARGRAIISSGERRGGDPLVARVAAATAHALGSDTGVLRFPEDTGELGATTNAQGLFLRSVGGRFVHVELDEGLRRDLLADESLRAAYFRELAAALEDGAR